MPRDAIGLVDLDRVLRTDRDAPKIGWCWAANRHTWLGFGSADSRVAIDG